MDLEEFVVESSSREYSRKVWLYKGPNNEKHPLCILLDGEHYIESVEILPILDSLIQYPEVPRISYLFVSYKSAEDRHKDYICNPQFSKYVAEDLVA